MPRVARSLQYSSCAAAFRLILHVAMAAILTSGTLSGQDASGNQNPPATTSESPPVPAGQNSPEATPAATMDEKSKAILEQEKLTRTIRALRNPISRPSKEEGESNRKQYNSVLAKGSAGAADLKALQTQLQYLIFEITEPTFLQDPVNAARLLDQVTRDVQSAGKEINPNKVLEFRRTYCGEVLKIVKQLLDNNLDARMLAVRVMGVLHEAKTVSGGKKAEMFVPAITELRNLLQDPAQPDSLKAVTASVVKTVLETCEVRVQDQFLICDALESEVLRPNTDPDYQTLILDAAMEIKAPIQTVGPPKATSLRIFGQILSDVSRPAEVRCRAALGVGRAAFDPSSNLPFMKLESHVYHISIAARDAVLEYNNGDIRSRKWETCGRDLFFAFWHVNQSESKGDAPLLPKGLLNRLPKSAVVNSLGPIIKDIALKLAIHNSKFDKNDVAPLAAWIQSNPPK